MAASLLPRGALAQSGDSDKAAAVALYDQAEALMSAGKLAAACSKYAESNRLDPQLGALLHLADCYEKNAQLASAWASWRDAVEIAERRGDPRQAVARDRARALEPKLSKLLIEVPAGSDLPELEIRRDGTLVSRSLWGTVVPVDAAEHVIEVSAPGRKKIVAKLTVSAGAAVATYRVPVLDEEDLPAQDERVSAVATGTTTRRTGPPIEDRGASAGGAQRILGWTAGGLGFAALGAGVLFELQRSSKTADRDDICPSGKNCTLEEKRQIDVLNDDVARASTLETISFVAGGVLLAGGATLLLTAPSSGSASAPRWTVGPTAARSSVGFSAIGKW